MIDHETFAQLEEFGIPAGAEVVIYDRIRRKAVFYHKNADRYRFKLWRDKRSGPIYVRNSDYIFTVDFDGRITAGDMLGVFERK